MPYTRIIVHIVFSTIGRQKLIVTEFEESLHKYITGIIQGRGCKLIAVNSMPDHCHILIDYKLTEPFADLIRELKRSTTDHYNRFRNRRKGKLWGEGYGAFSCDYRNLDLVIRYIENQKEHHRTKKFTDEYRRLIRENDIEIKEDYFLK